MEASGDALARALLGSAMPKNRTLRTPVAREEEALGCFSCTSVYVSANEHSSSYINRWVIARIFTENLDFTSNAQSTGGIDRWCARARNLFRQTYTYVTSRFDKTISRSTEIYKSKRNQEKQKVIAHPRSCIADLFSDFNGSSPVSVWSSWIVTVDGNAPARLFRIPMVITSDPSTTRTDFRSLSKKLWKR